MHRITKTAMSILAIGSLTLAACGGDDDDGAPVSEPSSADATTADVPASDSTAATTTAAAAPATPATSAAPATTDAASDTTDGEASGPLIELAETDLGQVIVAADGLTLYMFVPDSDGEPTCTGGCAGTWPPYYVEASAELTAGDGLDPALLSVVAHPDGGDMLRYGDRPLYYFANDQAPGDRNGQGLNDVWWVVDGAGAPIQNAALTTDGADTGLYNY